MICPSCGHDNPDGAKFCIECAHTLTLEPLCPECGHPNPQGSKFREECAYSLAEPTPEAAVTPQPPAARPSHDPTSFADGRYQVKK